MKANVQKIKTSWSKVDTFYRVCLPTMIFGGSALFYMKTAEALGIESMSSDAGVGLLVGTSLLGAVAYGFSYFATYMTVPMKRNQLRLANYLYMEENEFDKFENRKGAYQDLEDLLQTSFEQDKGRFKRSIVNLVGKSGYYNVKLKLLLKDEKKV